MTAPLPPRRTRWSFLGRVPYGEALELQAATREAVKRGEGEGRLILLEAVSSPAPLAYTPEIARATAPVYERVKSVIPAMEWPVFAPYVDAINRLKRQRSAVVLAHNYQTPEIFHGVRVGPEPETWP